tara:strand:+ start:2981 stop:3229 length:249 start_codon:yes stop_codon:yes gene_type:complete
MIEESYIAVAGIAAILFAVFRMLQGQSKSKKSDAGPPTDRASKVALDNVQEDLKEEINRIQSATTGDSPADDLADLGNARRR